MRRLMWEVGGSESPCKVPKITIAFTGIAEKSTIKKVELEMIITYLFIGCGKVCDRS